MNGLPKHCVLAILTLVGLVSANGINTVNAEQRPLSGPLAGTFRIRSQATHGNTLVTGHGTAWGVNLEEFGYNKHRYVMTACHVVREHDGSIAPNLQLEMRHGGGVRWANLRVLASDPKMDVAVLECERELPVSSNIADHNAVEQTPVAMIGSPGGVPLRILKGYVTGNKRTEPSVAFVEYIQEGCSGGPVFDARSQDVIGLVIAGIAVGNSEKMDPHTCLYVSVSNMKRFLRASLRPNGESQSAARNPSNGNQSLRNPSNGDEGDGISENRIKRESRRKHRNDKDHETPKRDMTCDSCYNREFLEAEKQCPRCEKAIRIA